MEPVSGAIAGANAVGKAVKAVQSSKEVEGLLIEAAKSSPQFERAAKALAAREETKQVIRTRLWQPLGRLFGVPPDDFVLGVEEELAERLDGIAEEDVVAPAGSVASPTIAGLRATVDEPELRNLYLNLLANASDRTTAGQAHPSFAAIIGQLSACEAEALKSIFDASLPVIPIVDFRATSPEVNGYQVEARNVIPYELDDPSLDIHERAQTLSVYVDNWTRLGLFAVDMSESLTAPNQYDWAGEENPYRTTLDAGRKFLDPNVTVSADGAHGIMRRTSLGDRFYRAVIADRISDASAEAMSG